MVTNRARDVNGERPEGDFGLLALECALLALMP
jgi:hypothetical protein